MTILIKIEPTKRDLLYEFKRFINGLLALWGQAHLGGIPGFNAEESIPATESKWVRDRGIKWLGIGDGTDITFLNDRTLFPQLQSVCLSSEQNHAEHLRQLAKNFPKITNLTIKQRSQLSTFDASSLQRFKQLRYLDLQCPHESDANFWNSLPEKIEMLQTDDCSPNLDLPKLTELRINRCRVESDFFDSLKTPRLERVYLWRVDLQPGSLKPLKQQKSLKELKLHNTKYQDSDIESIRDLEYLSIFCQL